MKPAPPRARYQELSFELSWAEIEADGPKILIYLRNSVGISFLFLQISSLEQVQND